MKNKILLIGGSNIDYIAVSKDKLIKEVSNIGTITISYGGVMRNIAENLTRLGNDISFITAIGNDLYGKDLKEKLIDLGTKVYSPITSLPTGSYLAINDVNHDMIEAICDNRIISTIDSNYLKSLSSLFLEHEYIFMDSNLDEETINYVFTTYSNKKIIVESISPTKVLKYKPFLNKIYMIKCNIHEAIALSDNSLSDSEKLTNYLLEKGVKKVIVSNGGKDIFFGENNIVDSYKVNKLENIANTTGCGDALISGIVDYYLANKTLKEAISFGQKLAELTLKTTSATTIEVEKYRKV